MLPKRKAIVAAIIYGNHLPIGRREIRDVWKESPSPLRILWRQQNFMWLLGVPSFPSFGHADRLKPT